MHVHACGVGIKADVLPAQGPTNRLKVVVKQGLGGQV